MTTKRPMFSKVSRPPAAPRGERARCPRARCGRWRGPPPHTSTPRPCRCTRSRRRRHPEGAAGRPAPSRPGPRLRALDLGEPSTPAAAPLALAPTAASVPSEQSLSRLEAALLTLKLQGERLAEQARSDALEVGLLVARRILEREISTDLEALFSLIKSAVRRVGEAHATVVRLSPRDFARLKEAADSSFSLGPDRAAAPTRRWSRGDVMVDTDHHTIDGRLKTRLEEIGRALGDEEALMSGRIDLDRVRAFAGVRRAPGDPGAHRPSQRPHHRGVAAPGGPGHRLRDPRRGRSRRPSRGGGLQRAHGALDAAG